MLTTEIRAC